MKARSIRVMLLLACCLYAAPPAGEADAPRPAIFDGSRKTIVVNGYSTSFRWPDILRRKLRRYLSGRNTLTVVKATRGGTPVARWVDVENGRRLEPGRKVLQPALNSDHDGPVVVLAQQSLQWVFGPRRQGIRGRTDRKRIRKGADVLEAYVELLKEDGADLVFLSTHIYKKPMEPQIGNERLALDELMSRGIDGLAGGPDVWTATRALYPEVFAEDGLHPDRTGAAVLAQLWFERLLAYDGREVPEWSRQEMKETVREAVPRRTKWQWCLDGVLWGQSMPNLPCFTLDGERRNLADLWSDRPALLVTVSLTDPVARRSVSDVQDLARRYGDRIETAVIYVIEAFPAYQDSPYEDCDCVQPANKRDRIYCRQPRKLADRLELARRLREDRFLSVPVLVDGMEDRIWQVMGGGRNVAALVRQGGSVFAKQSWFKGFSMEEEIEALLAAGTARQRTGEDGG